MVEILSGSTQIASGVVILGLGFAGRAGISRTGNIEYTTLYRSMNYAEYESYMNTGKFSTVPGAMESKWFSTTYEGAQHFQNEYPLNNQILSIQVPTSALNGVYSNTNIDGTGMGYCFDIDYLNSLLP